MLGRVVRMQRQKLFGAQLDPVINQKNRENQTGKKSG